MTQEADSLLKQMVEKPAKELMYRATEEQFRIFLGAGGIFFRGNVKKDGATKFLSILLYKKRFICCKTDNEINW